MLFANDIVSVDESRDSVTAKLKRWPEALEFKGFKKSCTKKEYMNCNFMGHIKRVETTMKIEAHEMQQIDFFHYPSSIISVDGEIDGDVEHRIKAEWLKWRLASEVLCDQRMPTRLKGKFYRIATSTAMTYGAKCWPIKKQDVTEMRMLWWMCGKTI